LLLISIPTALGAAEPAPAPPDPAPLISPACPPQSSAPGHQAASQLPAPLADAIWLSCTQSQARDQECYDLYCAGNPVCIDCYEVYCSGTYSGCQCDWGIG